ncbi:hypothetical protein [Enterobacter cloacae]|uniref:hypothetical protein n=1 Tax=Enterobacter cloacae TaxID=550 RepID=UPI0029C05BE5|nr:hypothetical protein [Enterobacter cloacae]
MSELQLDVDEVALNSISMAARKCACLKPCSWMSHARRLDREEALIHFTYAYRVAGRWQHSSQRP